MSFSIDLYALKDSEEGWALWPTLLVGSPKTCQVAAVYVYASQAESYGDWGRVN